MPSTIPADLFKVGGATSASGQLARSGGPGQPAGFSANLTWTDPGGLTAKGPAALTATVTSISVLSGVVTFTTAAPHGFAVGQVAVLPSLTNNQFDGYWTITAVTSTTFSAGTGRANAGPLADSGPATVYPPVATHKDGSANTILQHNVDGCLTINVSSQGNAIRLNSINPGASSNAPFTFQLTCLTGSGPDNVFAMGFLDDIPGQPIVVEALESRYAPDDPPFGFVERYLQAFSLDRTVRLRPRIESILLRSNDYVIEYWGKTFTWHGQLGATQGALNTFTIDNSGGVDKGTITLANDGTAQLLLINNVSADGLTGSTTSIATAHDQGLQVISNSVATAGHTTYNSAVLRLDGGSYWNGAAAVAVGFTIYAEVTGNNRWYANFANLRVRNDGVLLMVDPSLFDSTVFLGSSPVAAFPHGYLTALNQQGNATLHLIGAGVMNANEDVISLAPSGAHSIHLGSPVRALDALATTKALLVQNNQGPGTYGSILACTADGRTTCGLDRAANSVLDVNFLGGKTSGNLVTFWDGTSQVVWPDAGGFFSTAPNFGIGSNNVGAALAFNAPTANNLVNIEATNVAFFFPASLGGGYGGGSKVVFINNATTVPTTNPTGGGLLYVDAGAIKWRGSSGTITTLGAA